MCCLVSTPRLQNTVVVFRASPAAVESAVRGLEASGNFYLVRREGGLSFTVFPSSGRVTATGIGGEADVEACLDKFCPASQRVGGGCGWRVVNRTYSGSVLCASGRPTGVCQALELYRRRLLQQEADNPLPELLRGGRSLAEINFRSQFFPSARLRWKGEGTLNLFNNGRFVIVGATEPLRAELLALRLDAIMRLYWRTLRPGTRCAWAAASSSTGSSGAGPAASGAAIRPRSSRTATSPAHPRSPSRRWRAAERCGWSLTW